MFRLIKQPDNQKQYTKMKIEFLFLYENIKSLLLFFIFFKQNRIFKPNIIIEYWSKILIF
jgi:hypothetical protein